MEKLTFQLLVKLISIKQTKTKLKKKKVKKNSIDLKKKKTEAL